LRIQKGFKKLVVGQFLDRVEVLDLLTLDPSPLTTPFRGLPEPLLSIASTPSPFADPAPTRSARTRP
jgi:hypothetical protein